MLKKGSSLAEIARKIGRGKQTIAAEVSKNGGRDAYKAAEAHKSATQRKVERDIKCSYAIKNRFLLSRDDLVERIENLEMQLEIISETLKEVTRERNKINNRL